MYLLTCIEQMEGCHAFCFAIHCFQIIRSLVVGSFSKELANPFRLAPPIAFVISVGVAACKTSKPVF